MGPVNRIHRFFTYINSTQCQASIRPPFPLNFSKSSGVPSNMLVESRWTCSLPHQRPGVMFVKKIITTSTWRITPVVSFIRPFYRGFTKRDDPPSTSLSLKTRGNLSGAWNRPPPCHCFFQEITIIDH